VSSILIETFERDSRCSRSASWRLVTNLPSRPAKGEVFTRKLTLMVGGSMAMRGSGSSRSAGHTVSPISMESTPARITMSPARARSSSTRSMPLVPKSLVTRNGSGRPDSGTRTT
jgi:CO/xanthine dehydrogenase Mo-binding subunit